MTSAVEQVIEQGRVAFPELAQPSARVRALIATRLEGESDPTHLVADELYLAAACAAGDSNAIAVFERRYFGVIGPALGRLSLGREEIADVTQALRFKLFVSEGGAPPRVVGYAGHGQLGGLVRVAAVRAGLSVLRAAGRLEHDDDGLEDVPIASDDPALSRLKSQHRAVFKAAFEEAVSTLEPRERTLLDLAIVKGLGIDKIGAIYGVHRATAARWVQQARGSLASAVQRAVATRLGVRPNEVDDLTALVESKLELSLDRLLRSRIEPG